MSDQYHVRLVGGQNLTKLKPIFVKDKLLISTNNTIIGFLMRNGKQNQLIKLNDNHPYCEEKYVSICLHPVASDFQLFSFIENGCFFNWNYSDSTLIKEYDLKLNELFDDNYQLVWGKIKNYYYDASNHLIVYYAVKYLKEDGKYGYKIYATPIDDMNSKEELISLSVFDEHRISFGRNQNYLILIDKVEIYFIGLRNGFKHGEIKTINSKKRFKFKDRLKIVCCNPLKDSFAYTCKDGVIRLITIDTQGNLMNDTKARLHWHQMQITDMCYSSNGVYLYSVGFESTVVRWNLESLDKNFISDVGHTIKSIVCDDTNHSIAITLHNNEIKLITSHFDSINKSLSNLNYFSRKDIETGLIFDPKHDAIVLNGRPGCLQFYSPLNEQNVLLLQIINTRFIITNRKDSKFRNSNAINMEIYRIAISDCGNWLVTYEMRDDRSTELETKLKFWKYLKGLNPMQLSVMRTNEDYDLQTTINLPHKLIINEMKFSKNSNYLITTSEDGSFKIWINNRSEHDWYCLFSYTFQNDLIPFHISTSFDSSMFAINYNNLLTIWNAKDLSNVKYIDTLKQTDDEQKEDYIALEFGTGMMSHLIAGCTSHKLIVWNVSKAEIKMTYTLPIEQDIVFKQMIYNSSTKNLLLLDSVGHLDVFSINSNDGKPLVRIDVDCNLTKEIKFLIFISQSNYKFKQLDDLFGDQMICFMTISKKLFILEHKQSKENREKFKLKSDIIETTEAKTTAISTFVQELIDRKANYLKQGDYNLNRSLETLNCITDKCNLNRLVDEMFYNVPSHVLPPVQMIAKPFLRSLLNVENLNQNEEKKSRSNGKQILYTKDVIENSENEMEIDKKIIDNETSIDLFKNEKLASSFVFEDEDYSFLSK